MRNILFSFIILILLIKNTFGMYGLEIYEMEPYFGKGPETKERYQGIKTTWRSPSADNVKVIFYALLKKGDTWKSSIIKSEITVHTSSTKNTCTASINEFDIARYGKFYKMRFEVWYKNNLVAQKLFHKVMMWEVELLLRNSGKGHL